MAAKSIRRMIDGPHRRPTFIAVACAAQLSRRCFGEMSVALVLIGSRLLFRQRDRAGSWLAVTCLDVRGSLQGVLSGSERITEPCRSVLRFREIAFQIVHAPSTPRSRAATFAELTGTPGLMDAHEVHDLPLGDVKAVANRVIKFHGECPDGRVMNGSGVELYRSFGNWNQQRFVTAV